MSHIQHMARKRNVVQFFGTDCMAEKMAHEAIERHRVDDENGMLRAEIADLKRELALVAAIERAEAAHRYPLKTLEMTQSYFDYLQGAVKAERRPAEIEAQAARSIEALAEVDSE